MKVIYYIGKGIGFDTVMKKGIFRANAHPMIIESEEGNIVFDNLISVDFIKLNGLGTMVKLQNSSDIIYIAVPRIFIDKGTGFAIINYFATKKLKHLLEVKISR